MNVFAALTCTIFAWGLAEGSKVFLRNFQSVEAIFHRTHRTHSNDRFGTNIRGCSGLRCTNQADGILQGVQLSQLYQQSRRHSSGGAAVSAAPTKQTAFFRGCSCTNKADDTLQGVQLSQLHQQSRRHSCAAGWCTACSVGALLALASGKAERRQVHPLEDTKKNPFNPINPLLILRTRTI